MVRLLGKIKNGVEDHHPEEQSSVADLNSEVGNPGKVRASTTSSASTHSQSSSSSIATTPKTVGKLRIQVLGAHDLAAQDRNGLADPFIIVNLPGAPPPLSNKKEKDFYRRRTPVQPKTLDPKWKETEATFEWDITSDWYLSSTETAIAQNQVFSTDQAAVRSEESNALSVQTPLALTESPMVEKQEDPLAAEGARLKPDTIRRPSNVRKLSAATGKILGAPVRMTTKGAVATGRVVRRKGPRRPIRVRRGTSANGNKPSNGTVDLHTLQQATVGSVEFVVWDKDKWSQNDYMGECSLQVSSWIAEGKSALWDASQPMRLPLVSSRRNAKVSGEIIVRVGLVADTTREADDVYNKLVVANNSVEKAGIRSIPADESVGTTGPSEAFVDYDSSSDSESEPREELLWDEGSTNSESDGDDDTTTEVEEEFYESDSAPPGVPVITTTTEPAQDSGEETKPRQRRYLIPKRLRKSPSYNLNSATTSDVGDEEPSQAKQKKVRVRVRRRKRQTQDRPELSDTQDVSTQRKQRKKRSTRQQRDFAFQTELGMDIIGIVQMEVKGAQDLPRWKNSLGTGFDMDAFVIVSFGQRVFRTRVARHSLNPIWDEKLLFRVRQHESNFVTKLAVYDWDKLSSNDFVGSTELKISELIEVAPKADPETGLYAILEDGLHDMKKFQLGLVRNDRLEESKTLGKHAPKLTVEAKFTPYSSLRQRFWRQLLMQYDTNDSGTLSSLELTSMLDSLGSTLTSKTIQGLFSQFGKDENDECDELTIDEAIIALEKEISKPWSEKRYVDGGWDATPAPSGTQTPATLTDFPAADFFSNAPMDYSGPHAPSGEENELAASKAAIPVTVIDGVPDSVNERSTRPIGEKKLDGPRDLQRGISALSVIDNGKAGKRKDSANSVASSTEYSPSGLGGNGSREEQQVERVIVLKSCPLCHMPRLSKKAEVDIVTHLAVCASQDWRRVDSMVVGNFVTASQAQRKWYTKVISKISSGQYQLGANSANIIVQDRMTGELLEEKMQVYVRLGIRLLYKGARSRMEGARIKRMLKNMSVKQGVKFDSPLSAREIPQFIAFHNLRMDEVREPLENFKTFNEFFYRKLKEDARPIADKDDPTTLVSSADCRLMAFSSITEATKVWIKGREFTVDRLLGEKYKDKLQNYRQGGSLVIFRLAPQDYHRFHCPADATILDISMIQGQYYTVNPMAIRSAIDVYGENVRAVVQFQSKEFGIFYCVCIGAMMVGSINLVVKKGDQVKRGDEFGYYAFGGSTNVCM